MELYTKNVIFCIWLDIFKFENFGDWEKRPVFYKFNFILANEKKL